MPQRPPPSPGRPPAQTVKASPPPPPATTGVAAKPGGPVAVTDTEIVGAHVRIPRPSNPHHPRNIKTLGSNSAVQHAPPAFDEKGNIHVRNDHPLLAPATRAGIPPVRPGGGTRPPAQGVSPAPVPTKTPAGAAVGRTSRDIGLEKTGQAPAPSPTAADPLAKTSSAAAPSVKNQRVRRKSSWQIPAKHHVNPRRLQNLRRCGRENRTSSSTTISACKSE